MDDNYIDLVSGTGNTAGVHQQHDTPVLKVISREVTAQCNLMVVSLRRPGVGCSAPRVQLH